MTGPGEQHNQPNDAWWAREQAPQGPQYSQSDPTMVGQPGQLPPQPGVPAADQQVGAAGQSAGAVQQPADPTILRQSFDQPGAAPAGYQSGTGYQQPGYQQSSPGYPQPGFQQPGFQQQPAPGFQQEPAPGYQQAGFQQSAPGFQQSGFQQPAPGFQQPGFQQAGFQQPPPGYPQPPKSGGKGWLWALGAIVVTSAVWAGAMFAIGAFDAGKADISTDADLRGYKYVDNLCDLTDTSPYTSAGFALSKSDSSGDTYPKHKGSKHAAVDSMGCDVRFTPSGSTEKYDYAAIYTSAQVHKQTNPGPEFTATYETWSQTEYGKDAKIDKISGLGDQAYLITGKHKADDPTADVSVAVRDGWTTYHISWSQYSSSSSKSPGKILSAAEATELLKKTANSTMSKLRK
ncbi:hypothetical protein OG874_18570 [Nocardia sp. NBC_00565]|uniref:hypothetical protein n=1 Tax=Nocardia sp. NBC_00565 TaxID=2975993 RepID=UPI002E81B7F2|nr:hypothetical protein [Nocardia sp. NBC_00565]WUC06978.1 hypothetical protein OG874_18570 [Nocardia sp. NBC_00565]